MTSDVLTFVVPLLLVGIGFGAAARFGRRIPTRLGVYRFHVVAYLVIAALGLASAKLMNLSQHIDWWIDDAAVSLALLFSISGVVLCLVLAPVVWWLERRPVLTKTWRIGAVMINTLTCMPYLLIVGLLLFYRE